LGMILQGVNLRVEFSMRMKKIKVYTLTDEGASSKCIETMKREDRESLVDPRVCLEEKRVLKFEFQYLDSIGGRTVVS
jgi:hypothetical protein